MFVRGFRDGHVAGQHLRFAIDRDRKLQRLEARIVGPRRWDLECSSTDALCRAAGNAIYCELDFGFVDRRVGGAAIEIDRELAIGNFAYKLNSIAGNFKLRRGRRFLGNGFVVGMISIAVRMGGCGAGEPQRGLGSCVITGVSWRRRSEA
ncbi:hypothetical protein [Hyphomicrobium sp. D-2]|uniref:hypothetical protein n=1 Tax=Hyphomicrobium sp. D-2 TaxID=3041621 RepID=UPI0024546BAE|nr:hypothetical protein [Hyphomicrobium sp. D-2]MDH4982876.1 hypothetical protein [Hyphomicrobium sp. D-2]